VGHLLFLTQSFAIGLHRHLAHWDFSELHSKKAGAFAYLNQRLSELPGPLMMEQAPQGFATIWTLLSDTTYG
jgi:hypothetical protein